jgi:23S rRNA pseudouridine1911/1915/1917 synthase
MNDLQTFSMTVAEDALPERLDRVLSAALAPDFSRARVQALISEGQVLMNGAVVLDASQKVRAGAELSLTLPPPVEAKPQAEPMALDVLYEDEHLIVINKPAGLVVHPAHGHDHGTLVNALLAHCGDSLSGIGGVKRPGIVHRLDKDTTGVMVVAKHDRAHRGLAEQFADHGREGALVRQYIAYVWGRPNPMIRQVEAPLGRDKRNAEKIAVRKDGKWALTLLREVEAVGPKVSRVVVELMTGRTHQIRVHMAHIGHPLLGDGVYGNSFKTKIATMDSPARTVLESFQRQALHAATLGFIHPMSEKELLFEADLPADMQALDDALRATL